VILAAFGLRVKRMIELMLYTAAPPDATTGTSNDQPTRLARLYVRLSSGDWSLLRERAAARCVAPATYVSNLNSNKQEFVC